MPSKEEARSGPHSPRAARTEWVLGSYFSDDEVKKCVTVAVLINHVNVNDARHKIEIEKIVYS